MTFSITFLDEPLSYPYEDPAAPAARGVLVLGDTKEHFLASLYEWSKESYESQWRHAIKTLLLGNDKAALITTYGSPDNATHLEWWPMYVAGGSVFLQDHLLFYDRLPKPFSVENAFSFVRDRRTVDEDGTAISEWMVNFSDVKEFARSFV